MSRRPSSLPEWVWASTTTATLISQFSIVTVGDVAAVPTFDKSTGEFSLYRTSISALTGLLSPALVAGATYSITVTNTSASGVLAVRAGTIVSSTVVGATIAAGVTATRTFTASTATFGSPPYIGISGVTNSRAYTGQITSFYRTDA